MQTKPAILKRIFELRLNENNKWKYTWKDISKALAEENGRKQPYNTSYIERLYHAYGGVNGPTETPVRKLHKGVALRDRPKGMLARTYARTILMEQMYRRGVRLVDLAYFFCTDQANVARRIRRLREGNLKRVPDKVFLLKTKGLEGDDLQAKIVELARIPDYDKTQTIHNKGRVRTLTLGGGYEPEIRPSKKGRVDELVNGSL